MEAAAGEHVFYVEAHAGRHLLHGQHAEGTAARLLHERAVQRIDGASLRRQPVQAQRPGGPRRRAFGAFGVGLEADSIHGHDEAAHRRERGEEAAPALPLGPRAPPQGLVF